LASLDDNRWGGRAESISNSMNGFLQGGGSEPSERSGSGGDVFETVSLQDGLQEDAIGRSSLSRLGEDITHRNGNSGGNVGGLTINFEELFHSFGGILHNEVGSLVLYTLLQSSPIFAKSLAVRSGNDLENLVLPLLRTLYVSSSSSHHISGRTTMSRSKWNDPSDPHHSSTSFLFYSSSSARMHPSPRIPYDDPIFPSWYGSRNVN